MSGQLQRLVITFDAGDITARVLYRRSGAGEGPGPETKARAREVRELTRTGLERALAALDGSARVDVIGTSGFETREDTLSVDGRAA